MEIMLLPPVLDRKKSALVNLDLWMNRMMDKLNVKVGGKVLDMGCGRGLIAKNFVDWRNVSVTGINIDETQVEFATRMTKDYPKDKIKFITRDYNLPFDFLEPNSLDGGYCAQACMFVDNKTEFMKNLGRVLKKGGRFYGLEYVYLLPGETIDPKSPGFDPNNQTQRHLVQLSSTILGTSMPGPIKAWTDGFQKNGFKIIYVGHPTPINSVVLLQDINDTYEPLQHLISFLGKFGLMSERFVKLFERLRMYWESLIKMMYLEYATPTYELIAEKL
jgi:sterol 24-C-methyltransferase